MKIQVFNGHFKNSENCMWTGQGYSVVISEIQAFAYKPKDLSKFQDPHDGRRESVPAKLFYDVHI